MLLASPLLLSPGGAAYAADQPPQDVTVSEVVVYGLPGHDVLLAERELDENGIAAYGFDNIGDLVNEVLTQLNGSVEGPLVLLNGRTSNGVNDIADLPTEAVSKIQVLPPSASVLLGQPASRRVVNVVVKENHAQVTLNGEAGQATAGGGGRASAEAGALKLAGGSRRSLSLKATRVDPLLEAERDVPEDPSAIPYAHTPNVISPLGGEIDPALSRLAGRVVTLAGTPAGVTSPTLATLAARADIANLSDLGRYRTLLPGQQSYAANLVLSQRLSDRTTLSMNLRADHFEGESLNGITAALLPLPAGSPFSPFSRDVALAAYLGGALRQTQRADTLSASGVANGQAGRWRLSTTSTYNRRTSRSVSDRGLDVARLAADVAAGAVNPFAPIDAARLGSPLRDRARSRSENGAVDTVATGPLLTLPNGPAMLTLRLAWRGDRSTSRTEGASVSFASRLERNETIASASLQVPLLGRAQTRDLGDLSADLSGALRRVTASDPLADYAIGLDWRSGGVLNLRAAYAQEREPPPSNVLTDPVVTYDNFRTYDFIHQETVLVRYITGGNPQLPIERRGATTLSAFLRPFASVDFSLSADYSRLVSRDVYAALPPMSAEVQAAFADRFVTDAAGRLVEIDARPVAFARNLREQLRWGMSFSRTLGVGPAGAALASGWRVNASFNDTWTLRSRRLAREGLPEVDLLAGGAVGYVSGQPRHQVQFAAGLVHEGVGLQLSGVWKGESRIAAGSTAAPSRIIFAPRTDIDARLFANLGPLFPASGAARGARVTLSVDNLFDSAQRVSDDKGQTPLRYRRYLLDPLGRTVTLALRKAF